MSTVAPTRHAERRADDRRHAIAAYQLTDYLERLGVEVVFGLCGHTVIALLDALGKSRIRFVSHAPRADRRACRRRLRARDRQAGRGAHASRAGTDQRRDRRRQCRARFDSDGGDRRRRASRISTAGTRTRKSTCTRTPTSSRSTGRSASASIASIASRICRAILERAFHLAQTGRPGPVLVDVPMDIFSADLAVDAFQKVPPPIARPTLDAARPPRRSSTRSRAPSGPCCTRAAACSPARATAELAALAEALEVPVAHTLMGKGCLHEDHPLLLGQTGFWGTPIAERHVPRRRPDSSPSARGSPKRIRARGIRGSRSRFRRRG